MLISCLKNSNCDVASNDVHGMYENYKAKKVGSFSCNTNKVHFNMSNSNASYHRTRIFSMFKMFTVDIIPVYNFLL